VTYMLLLNCVLKLVEEIILYYDARSKKHQIKLMQLISDAAYSTSNLRDEPSRGFPVIVRDFMFYTRPSSCFHEIN